MSATNVQVIHDSMWHVRWNDGTPLPDIQPLEAETEADAISEAADLLGVDESDIEVIYE